MEQHLSLDDILSMERFYRQAFINTLSGVRTACLIGTQNKSGVTNLAIFNSVVHLGANPPYLGFILRPTSVERHTYDNIRATGSYTINYAHPAFVQQAHQTSAKYPAGVSEFETCGFTEQFTPNCFAPYVQESLVKIGLQYEEEHFIKASNTILVVGKIMEVLLPENTIAATGHLNFTTLNGLAVSGLDTYYTTEYLTRLTYARVNDILNEERQDKL
ncbi:MAG: flavin reductase family protein [Saprospiraceae bacterium]